MCRAGGSTPLTHHTHTWVSSTITKDPPVVYTHRFGRVFVFQHAATEELQPRLRILRVGDDFQGWFSPTVMDQCGPWRADRPLVHVVEAVRRGMRDPRSVADTLRDS